MTAASATANPPQEHTVIELAISTSIAGRRALYRESQNLLNHVRASPVVASRSKSTQYEVHSEIDGTSSPSASHVATASGEVGQ